jgi:putative copper export protein
LLGKVALFLVMAGLGAANRFSFLPALAGDRATPALVRLRRAVMLESVLGLVVILIVGMMGATSPPLPGS